MNRKYILSFLPLLFLISCVTSKQLDSRADTSKEDISENFIITMDGNIIKGSKVEYTWSDGNGKEVKSKLTLDKIQYPIEQVKAYQDKSGYYRKFHKHLYARRLVSGKMNLYYRQFRGYQDVNFDFYFEKGDQPSITRIGVGTFRAAIVDNEEALKLLNSYYPKDNYMRDLNLEKMISVVKAYNK